MSKVHYLVIITVDPYVPYYIIVHEWIYILTQMQECIWTISQPPVWSSGARSRSSPRSICRQAHNASLARRTANSISLWSPSIVFCIASSSCCSTFVCFLSAATAQAKSSLNEKSWLPGQLLGLLGLLYVLQLLLVFFHKALKFSLCSRHCGSNPEVSS